MRKINENKAITLIALIITIVVLLILAVVAINAVKDEGIIGHAKGAQQEYKEATEKEKETLDSYFNYLDENEKRGNWYYCKSNTDKSQTNDVTMWVSDGNVILKIGSYVGYDQTPQNFNVNYTAKKESTGYTSDQFFYTGAYHDGWRILGIENGQILLMAASGVALADGKTNFHLKGETGYVNAIKELDAISALFAQGKYAEKGRSMTAEDLNKRSTYDPTNTGNSHNGGPYKRGTIQEYGNRITFTLNNGVNYTSSNGQNGSLTTPHTFFYQFDGKNFIKHSVNSSATFDIISTNYIYSMPYLNEASTGSNTWTENKTLVYEMSNPYWLANRTVAIENNKGETNNQVWYSLLCSSGGIQSSQLFGSSGIGNDKNKRVMPVIRLKASTKITPNGGNDNYTTHILSE